jgi:glucose/arabinose dehydrogenase
MGVVRVRAVALVLLLVGCGADGGGSSAPNTPRAPALRLERIATGLDSPLHVAATPAEPNRIYVVEQAGRILAVEDGRVRPEPFLDIRERVTAGGEQGLLSVAFHPRYGQNRFFYVNYTDVRGDTRVVR